MIFLLRVPKKERIKYSSREYKEELDKHISRRDNTIDAVKMLLYIKSLICDENEKEQCLNRSLSILYNLDVKYIPELITAHYGLCCIKLKKGEKEEAKNHIILAKDLVKIPIDIKSTFSSYDINESSKHQIIVFNNLSLNQNDLSKCFIRLNSKPNVENNLTALQIKEKIEYIAKSQESLETKAFVMIFLAHSCINGDSLYIDGEELLTEDIIQKLSEFNYEYLREKPKIFIFITQQNKNMKIETNVRQMNTKSVNTDLSERSDGFGKKSFPLKDIFILNIDSYEEITYSFWMKLFEICAKES